MVDVDPTEHEIAELGPKIKDVDDSAELEEMLALEEDGEDRAPVKTLIEDRIEKVSGEDEEDADPSEVDLTDLTVADIANLVRDVDEVSVLEDMLEREKDGKDRKTAKGQIESRIESVQGSDEAEHEERAPPEERHPELDHPTADKAHVRALEEGVYGDMWVYCETQQGALIDCAKEMLGHARHLMDEYNATYDADERVVGVVIGEDAESLAEEIVAYGADVALFQEDAALSRFRHKPYTEVFCDMARGAGHPYGREDRAEDDWRDYEEPRYVLFPATNNGRDLSAQVQAELDSGLASDCSDLFIDDVMISNPAKVGQAGDKEEFTRVLHMKRPDFSGFEYSTILCLDSPTREFHPQGASVIPGTFDVPDPDYEREGQLVEHDAPLESEWLTVDIEEFDQLDAGVDLTGHDVVVALGRGIGDDPTLGMELGLDLVDAFEDAALGITRGIVTSSYDFDGHVEQYSAEERQIGETGQVVEPDLYIAAGISGAIQHKVGMDESDTIVSINTDTEADIVDFSDYFIEGDLFEVLPRLTEAVESGELGAEVASAGGGDDD